MKLCGKHAEAMREKWAVMAWESGELNATAFLEARVRADCYRDIVSSTFDDWKAIDDTEA
jgi:hypothetical protein